MRARRVCLWERGEGRGRRSEAISCHVYVRKSTNLQLGGIAQTLRSSVLPVSHHASSTSSAPATCWHLSSPLAFHKLSLLQGLYLTCPPTLSLSLSFSLPEKKKVLLQEILFFTSKPFLICLHHAVISPPEIITVLLCNLVELVLSFLNFLCYFQFLLCCISQEMQHYILNYLNYDFCYLSWTFFLNSVSEFQKLILDFMQKTINIIWYIAWHCICKYINFLKNVFYIQLIL